MKSRRILGRAVIAGLLSVVSGAPPVFGADTYWTGGSPDFSNWSDTRNWQGGVTPNNSYGVIQFGDNSRTTSNNDLGSFSSNGIRFLSGAPGFTLNGNAINFFDNGGTQAKVENYSSNLSTINLGLDFAATQGANRAEINAIDGNLTVNGNVAITGSAVDEVRFFGGNARTLTLNGVISGSGKALRLDSSTTNTVVISNAGNSYSGGTFVDGGTLSVNSLPSAAGNSTIGTANLSLGSGSAAGTLQYTGATGSFNRSTTLGANGGTISVTNSATTLTISGVISGNGSLTKSGSGTLTLTSANLYNGATIISGGNLTLANPTGVALAGGTPRVTVNPGGTLTMGGNNQINQATLPGITLNGGSLNAGGFSQGTGGTSALSPGAVGLGALTLQSSSTISLDATSVLHFSSSSSAVWADDAILSVLNWSGALLTGGGAEQILFGTGVTGLSLAQLAQIQFVNPAGLAPGTYAAIFATDLTGEIVPGAQVPEPATVIGGALALGLLGWTQRRRLRAWLPARA